MAQRVPGQGEGDQQGVAEAPRCVLVVDDDEDLANLLGRWVQEHFGPSTDVHLAHTIQEGEEAIDRLPTLDIVLLDRHFPEGTGDQLVDGLRDDFDPIIVMTTGVEPSTRLIRLPVDDYLVKPIERAPLVKRLSLLEKLKASGVLQEFANARKATLLEFHLDEPDEDPLYRRFAARWDYDRLEVAASGDGTFVYELYTDGDGTDRGQHVEVSVIGGLDSPLRELVEEGTLVAVGELVPSGAELAWIDVDRPRYTDPPDGGYAIYEFTVDVPEARIDRTDVSKSLAIERDLETAFS